VTKISPGVRGRRARIAIALAVLLAAGVVSCARGRTSPRRPNIVVLLADDLGWRDVGYHGGDIATPNIDRLAEEGVRLERFYVAPLCSPTRAGLLTGRYPIRFGMMRSVITPWSRYGLPARERTLAEMLADAGYARRGVVGKWHLGHAAREYHPLSQGFTHFYGHLTGAVGYFSHLREGALDWHRDFETSHDQGYTTDLIAREAVHFIEASSPAERFFLYVAFNAPHRPLMAKPEDRQKYPRRQGARRTYAAMVDSLDQAIGRVLTALDAKGIASSTLVLFASDNGADPIGDNSPLRGGKSAVYEGGIRVPAVVRWPEGIRGRRQDDTVMGHIDVFPTLKRAAGLGATDPLPLDGRDMLDVLRGVRGDYRARAWFSFSAPGEREQIAVMKQPWKLVAQGPSVLDPRAAGSARIELFEVWQDPGEKHDVAGSHPEIVADLLARLRDFRGLQVPGVGAFEEGREGFTAPRDWELPE
jgi:arylsulfatase B